jgi:FMN-dependent NADH-azoreductase
MSSSPVSIIAIAASPSRGRNSDTMLDAFIAGARTVEGVTVEKIYLADIPIEHYSFENRLGPTATETAFGELTTRMQAAQALVIATPTYNFSVPAHLKNFIDRMRFFALDMNDRNALKQPRGKLSYLKTYFLVSGGTPQWAQKLLFFAFPPFWLRGVFLYYGAHVLGAIYTGNVAGFTDERLKAKCQKQGTKFARQVLQGRTNRLPERIFFRPPQID